jgi:septal ring factor EnvC (AmiA/AmiB activator)
MINQSRPVSAIQLVLMLLLVWVSPIAAQGQTQTDKAAKQQEVESRLLELKQSIAELQTQLEDAREEQGNEQAQLKAIDLSIQDIAHQIRELENQSETHAQELAELRQKRDDHLHMLGDRKEQLAEQIRATYQLASQSRVKLVLNQDNPALLNRMLAYYDHINRAQVSKIQSIKVLLADLERIYAQIDEEIARITQIQTQQTASLNQQESQKQEREALLKTLAAKISDNESSLKEMVRNRQDLEQLLKRLVDVLSDIPSNLGQHLGVAEQKGLLPVPVPGRVKHSFGQRRTAGMFWQGWIFDAESGTEVTAIAYGRIAFADWLRGYGLLMIIDHGQGFMSLYGYNESLLWEVGDWVEPATLISTVGSSPSGEQGLYFEMRKEGKAIDPAVWLKR